MCSRCPTLIPYLQIQAWVLEKKKYLAVRETIENVQESQLQLSLLDAYRREQNDKEGGSVAALVKRGQEIVSSEYKTDLSRWVYEKNDEVRRLGSTVTDVFWKEISASYETKRAYLEDALARNEVKERVLLVANRHNGLFARLEAWTTEKTAYLNTKEEIGSVADAAVALRLLEAFNTEKDNIAATSLPSLKQLGKEILTTRYSTSLSSWAYDKPDVIKDHEANVDASWVEMSALSTSKKKVLC